MLGLAAHWGELDTSAKINILVTGALPTLGCCYRCLHGSVSGFHSWRWVEVLFKSKIIQLSTVSPGVFGVTLFSTLPHAFMPRCPVLASRPASYH